MTDLDDALDLLYDEMDDHLENGELEFIDLFLEKVCVCNAHHTFLIGILATTLCASELLTERSSFYHRVEEEFRLTLSDEDTQDILKRLR
jgi:hypothetical protein